MTLKQRPRVPLVTKVRKLFRPAVVVLAIAMLSIATAFGSPEAEPFRRDEEEIAASMINNSAVVIPGSRLSVWRGRLQEKKDALRGFVKVNLGKAREKLIDFKRELHDHPSEEEIEKRKRLAEQSIKEPNF